MQQRETIREMAARSRDNVQNFKHNKQMLTKCEVKAKTEAEKRLIYKYEREA